MSIGTSMSACWSTLMPTIARVGILRARDRLDGDLLGLVVSSQGELDLGSGLTASDLATQLVGSLHGDAVHRDDHVAGVDHGCRGNVGSDVDHECALRLRDDVFPQSPKGDGGRDELRAGHLGCRLPVTLALGRAGRKDRLLGDDSRALGPQEGEQILESRGSADEDVDVVHVAVLDRSCSLDRDPLGERLGVSRGEDELLRRKDPERKCRRQPDNAERDQDAGEPLHGRVHVLREARGRGRRRRGRRFP